MSSDAVNVRMRPDLITQVDDRAADAHLQRSSWCREVLTAAVESGIGLQELCTLLSTATPAAAVPQGEKRVVPRQLGARKIVTGRCLHPVHGMRRYPTQDVCSGCGEVVRQR